LWPLGSGHRGFPSCGTLSVAQPTGDGQIQVTPATTFFDEVGMDYTDYAACARAAEVQADFSRSPEIAAGYRDLARCYQALAEECEHLRPRYVLKKNGEAFTNQSASPA
jgi:hypothetical protein